MEQNSKKQLADVRKNVSQRDKLENYVKVEVEAKQEFVVPSRTKITSGIAMDWNSAETNGEKERTLCIFGKRIAPTRHGQEEAVSAAARPIRRARSDWKIQTPNLLILPWTYWGW